MRVFGVLVALCLTMGCAQNSDEPASVFKLEGINGFRFGMSWEEAKEINVQWDTSSTLPSYHQMQIGPWVVDGYLSFSEDNKLITMNYDLSPPDLIGDDVAIYVITYLQVKSLLTSKYGRPIIEQKLASIYDLWGLSDDIFFDWTAQLTFTITSGIVQYLCVWDFPDQQRRILLILTRDDDIADWHEIRLIYSDILTITDDSLDSLIQIF